MTKRVNWEEPEWQKVIAFGKAQFNPKMNGPERFDAAQRNTLPRDRWRPKQNPNVVSEFNQRLRLAGVDLGYKKSKVDKHLRAKLGRIGLEIPTPTREAGPPVQEEKIQAPPIEPVEPAPAPAPSVAPDPLADLFARSFEPVLLKMLEAPTVKEKILAIVAEHYLPKVATEQPSGAKIIQLNRKPRLPKVVIVTKLKGHQTARLASEFTGLLSLYVWNTSRSIQELKNNLLHCDVAVCTVNNVSHGAMQMAKSRAPAFVACQAGIETIRKELLELIPGELTKENKV